MSLIGLAQDHKLESFARPESPPVDTRQHHCECLCQHCEKTGSGWFAQRAALDGDREALSRLSPELSAALVSLTYGGRRRPVDRKGRRRDV